jgi:dihydrofolate reductase
MVGRAIDSSVLSSISTKGQAECGHGDPGCTKRQDGPEIQVHGSPGLIQTLLAHDLIDELRIWIFPVLLGTGKRCFDDGTIPAALRLVDSRVTKTGVTINTYQRAGSIGTGSFEFEQPTEAELRRRERLARS